MRIEIKYHDPELIKLEQKPGSDWIDLRVAEDVEMKAGEFRLISLGVLAVVVAPCGARVHSALDISYIAEVLTVVVVVVRAFVVYDSGGVAGFNPCVHSDVVLTPAGFVTE